MRKIYSTIIFFITLFLVNNTLVKAQFGSAIGARSVSSLAWQQIESIMPTGINGTNFSIGLTTDGRVYTWGGNQGYTIHAQQTTNGAGVPTGQKFQRVPYYVPFPAGEVVKKVNLRTSTTNGVTNLNTFFALSNSGKLYAWGTNDGLLETAWPIQTTFTTTDTTKTKRRPVQLTILGESSFVDFDASSHGQYWVAIGTSGKAYHIGNAGLVSGGGIDYQSAFAALPNPTGANAATFKYTNVWLGQSTNPYIYLKGNDGKIYYTGAYSPPSAMAIGVPSISDAATQATNPYDANNNTFLGKVRVLAPIEVPFPVGEDIIEMKMAQISVVEHANFALSASGKAYVSGFWRNTTVPKIIVPLKSVPAAANTYTPASSTPAYKTNSVYLKQFTEIAMPTGATKIIDLAYFNQDISYSTLIVTDNQKAYHSGTSDAYVVNVIRAGNFLSISDYPDSPSYRCSDITSAISVSLYSWSVEALNYEGVKEISETKGATTNFFLMDTNGRGYCVGTLGESSGVGKVGSNAAYSPFPVPIANEQLLDCQTSPGTGGPLTGPVTPTNTAVGVIDCSKTKIAPAPVAGVPSQTTLIVSVNVTTIGDFTPITVSGSGMSLGNGITSVSTTATGVQNFYIPLQYDGSALTNSFQFTIGSAGSCTADLTQKSNKQVTNVWSLTNCSAVTPGVLSK